MTECWRDWGQAASGLHPMVSHGPQLILLVITYGNVHRILPAKEVHTSFHGQGFYWGQTYKCGLPKQLMLIFELYLSLSSLGVKLIQHGPEPQTNKQTKASFYYELHGKHELCSIPIDPRPQCQKSMSGQENPGM